MIKLVGISKYFNTSHGEHIVLKNINFQVNPGEKIGILGRNGTGKSTLIRIMCGVTVPDAGQIIRKMTMSWPLAFNSGIQGSLTGYDNINFICRIYNANIDKVLPFIKEFSELGDYLFEPTRSYSSGMKARLNFAISMAIDFDCLLIDEVLAVGDTRFKERCYDELLLKRKEKAVVLVSHEPNIIKELCNTVYVLQNNQLKKFDDIDKAFEQYENSV